MRPIVISLTAALVLLLPGVASADTGWVVAPSPLDFGSQVVGTSRTVSLEVTNELSQPMDVSLLGIDASSPFAMGFGSCDGASLDPGASCLLEVTYAPSATTVASATLTVTGCPPAGGACP